MTTRVWPHSEVEQTLRASLGRLLFRPWFDRAALVTLGKWVFPASRLWAAAEIAGDDVDRFVALTPALKNLRLQRGALGRALEGLARLRERADASERRWADTYFAARASQEALVKAEAARLRDGRLYLGARVRFMTLARRGRVPSVDWAIPTEAEAAAHLGAALKSPQAIFTGPDRLPTIVESKRLRKRAFDEYALRFALPGSASGSLHARVYEPLGTRHAPTVIHCHGFGMEPEHIKLAFDEFVPLVRAGVRLVRVTAPFHGSRRRRGTWSGEPFLSSVPVETVEALSSAVRELSVLVEWAKATSRGRVALAGVSMGALTAQLAAVHMRNWPAARQADALFLVGTTDRLDRIAFESTLTCALGLDAALRAKGWDADRLRHFASLTNPEGEPAIDRRSIFIVLGTADDVTPFDGGTALACRWRIPAENQFNRPHGHFSLSQGLIPDNAPLLRLAEHLKRGR